MKVARCGSGVPVVFIHGWAANGRVFDTCVAAFETTNECHVLDLPGHGTAAEGNWDAGFDAVADAVKDYVTSLDTPPLIVGWAMGGMLALKTAAEAPTGPLVCVGTASGGPDHQEAFQQMAQRMTRDWPRFVRSSVDVIVGDRVSPEMHAFMVDVMTSTPLPVARRTITELSVHDPVQWLSQVDVPILFVHGSEDRISPVEVSEKLAAEGDTASLLVYEGSGHAPHLEHPERFVSDVRDFWEKESHV
jgi:pimeloyl-[acyl-carrier protein] methyl ester esterase